MTRNNKFEETALAIEHRLTFLEERSNSICKKLDRITENELVHLKTDIEMLKRYLYLGLGALAMLQIILNYIKI